MDNNTEIRNNNMEEQNLAVVHDSDDEEKIRSLDIQSRPLPPLPTEEPGEPDDEAPEPAYESIQEGEVSYETVFHQRSISDHILNAGRTTEDEEKIKKSNSDRKERRIPRAASTNHDYEDDIPIIPEKKLSNVSKEARHYSCSTPSIHDDKLEPIVVRNRSTTTESSAGEEDIKTNRPRLVTSSEVGTIKLRDPSYFEPQKHRLVLIFLRVSSFS